MRRCRCLPVGALTLALGACFSPTGSVFTSQSTGAGDLTTTAGPGTSTGSTTGTTSVAETTSTGPVSAGTTVEPTTSASSEPTTATTEVATGTDASTTTTGDPPVCGDFVIMDGEQCDDGPLNGDDKPCTSLCQNAACGDGLVCSGCDVPEECDDGGADDGCSDECIEEVKLAFVTSTRHAADFGGQAGADQLCNGLAMAAGIHPARQFVAWLSGPEAAKDHLAPTSFKYVTRAGLTVAESPADLLDGSLVNPISTDETGQLVPGDLGCVAASTVWTGTNELGDPAENCGVWADPGATALVGHPSFADERWTKDCVLPCSGDMVEMRLYCIEKG